MKVLFAFILAILFLIGFFFILFTDNPNTGIITFTTLSFLVFVIYFGHVFLNLEISSKFISIKKRVSDIEKNQKELKHIATIFYKLLFLNTQFAKTDIHSDLYLALITKHTAIKKSLIPYLDRTEIDSFVDEIINMEKNINSS